MRGILAAVFFALAIASACGGDEKVLVTPGPSGGANIETLAPGEIPAGFESLDRNIERPDVPSGTCPVTPTILISPTLPMAVGDGPVYASGLGSATALNLLPGPSTAWAVGKVTFLADPNFSGKVLVRGGQVEGEDVIGWNYAPPSFADPETFALALDTADAATPGGSGWNYFYAHARVISPGCYFFQIDTEDGTDTIIFRAG